MTYYCDYGFDDFLKVGAKSDKDIERFVIKRLLKGVNIDLNISSAGCTAFTAANKSGERIYARNFDFDYAPSLLLYTKPSNGYKSISMVNLSFAGYTADYLPKPMGLSSFLTLAAPYLPFDGMNECGVVMALLAVPYAEPPAKDNQITLNTTTAIRLVLDKAANVDEAVALLKKYNYYFSGKVECHYLIADSSGKSVVVEFLDQDVKVTGSSKNYQVASNFIMYNNLNIGEGYDEFERYEKADKALELNGGVLSEDQAMKVLSEVMIPDRTQWSIVYNMISKDAEVCINKKYDNKYKFNLSK
jgi:penicillin V acylase-like amidase (Ntn superfamily)